MTEPEPVASAEPEIAPRRRGRFLQWNIATLLLLMTAVGVWTSYFRLKSETERMDGELDSLRQLARELLVSDPSQFAIVKRHEEWYGDDVWDVHCPEGSRYLLKLATREIGRDNMPDTKYFMELSPGHHVISLEKTLSGEDMSARAVVDGELAIEVSESSDWYPDGGRSSWGGGYNRSTQVPADKPLELTRMRFHKPQGNGTSSTPDEPYNGIFLWIERKP